MVVRSIPGTAKFFWQGRELPHHTTVIADVYKRQISFIEVVSAKLVAGAEDMRQLMQKNVLQLCRMTR